MTLTSEQNGGQAEAVSSLTLSSSAVRSVSGSVLIADQVTVSAAFAGSLLHPNIQLATGEIIIVPPVLLPPLHRSITWTFWLLEFVLIFRITRHCPTLTQDAQASYPFKLSLLAGPS